MMGRKSACVSAADATPTTQYRCTRRQVLRQTGALALLGATGIGSALAAAAGADEADPKRLRLVNVHTQEKISVEYWKNGEYQQESLNKINMLMRDFRANEVMYMDTNVIDYLYEVYRVTGSSEHIQILSGYRSPKTNEMLRKRSNGVAKNSLHIVGKAIDFRVPGQSTRGLQRKALAMSRGGIGYYKRSDFVHIDSGPFRHWE